MLLLEQYIEKRKQEDGLDEFDSSKKLDNIQICVNYIFDYFNHYLPIQGAEERTSSENKLLLKYENEIRLYSKETREWLCKIYCETGHKLTLTLMKYLKKHPEFFLFYQEYELRNISYNCYAEVVEKRPCVKNKAEELYRTIKEYHNVMCRYDEKKDDPQISSDFSEWLSDTWNKYNVNIIMAVNAYIDEFMDNQAWWPPGTRKKTGYTVPGYEYEYDDTKCNNRFNINRYFSLYGDRPFLKGRKKHLELLMICNWSGKNEIYQQFLKDNPKF